MREGNVDDDDDDGGGGDGGTTTTTTAKKPSLGPREVRARAARHGLCGSELMS